MPGRSYTGNGYRYGFNGKEKDDEAKGLGNSLDFGARVYDSRLGRFLSRDRKIKDYPWNSPYTYAANSPLMLIDKDGDNPALAAPFIIIGGVVITVGDALLISSGVITTGILLHQAQNGSLHFNFSLSYNHNQGWEWQKRENERAREQARKEAVAHALLVKGLLEMAKQNQMGDGNFKPGDKWDWKAALSVVTLGALLWRSLWETDGDEPEENLKNFIHFKITNTNETKPINGAKTVSVKYDVNYIVQKGDNLTGLAKKFNTTVEKLKEDNNIENVHLIKKGQTIKVGEGTYCQSVPSN